MLTIYEDLYLLALDEEKGNLFSFARKSFAYPLAGAILAELALSGKLGVGEKLRIVLSDATPIGDPILNDALEQIRVSEKTQP
jgi:golgi phosphoprotein 3